MNELIKQWVLATLAPNSYVVNTQPDLPGLICIVFYTEDKQIWTNCLLKDDTILTITHRNSTLPKYLDIATPEAAVQIIGTELQLEGFVLPPQ